MSGHWKIPPTTGNDCVLYRLPSEIRIMIWEYCFLDDEQYRYLERNRNPKCVEAFQQPNLKLYKEALETYFKRTTIHINPKTLRQLRDPRNSNVIKQIRSVQCDFRQLSPDLDRFLSSLAQGTLAIVKAQKLRDLTIRIWHIWMWFDAERSLLHTFLTKSLNKFFKELKTIRLEIIVASGLPLTASCMGQVKSMVIMISRMIGAWNKYTRKSLKKGSDLLQWIWIHPKTMSEGNCPRA